MAPWVKAHAAKPDKPSSITRSHMAEGENTRHKSSPDLHRCTMAHTYMHAYK